MNIIRWYRLKIWQRPPFLLALVQILSFARQLWEIGSRRNALIKRLRSVCARLRFISILNKRPIYCLFLHLRIPVHILWVLLRKQTISSRTQKRSLFVSTSLSLSQTISLNPALALEKKLIAVRLSIQHMYVSFLCLIFQILPVRFLMKLQLT